ncbi:MAG: hypothetical protein WC552_01135 [Candidatus Omnitrophota bacterium]
MRHLIIFLSIILFATGCSLYQITSEDTTLDFYSPKASPNDVAFLETVNQPHQEIGFAIVNTERRQSLDMVIEKLKREAAILGGDAITNIQTDATGFWKSLPAQQLIGQAYIRANFKATVIVFK